MSGPVALLGGGDFVTSLADFDHALLAATGRRRPRVVILPTAAASRGEDAFQRVAALGQEHFHALGAEVEVVAVRTREDAADAAHIQAIREADVIYLCDGSARHLRRTLQDSAVWDAVMASNDAGAILVGCGAAAMVVGARQMDMGLRAGVPLHWSPALGGTPGLLVLPAYDARPEPVMALLAMTAPDALPVMGIDRETAVIGRDGSWEVHGRARVTVWRGRHRERHRRGEAFRLSGSEPEADSERI